MDTWFVFALIGLGAGAIYASLAIGLVVTYKGTGVINFATGAMAMWGAYIYAELRETGDLVFPVVGMPDRMHVADPAPFTVALAIGLLTAALVGLLVHLLVFRPLATAPVLAKVVASVGVMIVVQAMVGLKFGTDPRVLAPILPNEPVHLAGISVNRDRLYIAAIAALLGLVLAAWFRWSRTGLAVRASAENEEAASLAGYSPQFLAGITWIASSAAVGLMVILTAPTTNLNPVNYTLFVVPALAVALVGRLTSLWVTVVAGLGLGILQSDLTYAKTQSWFPDFAQQGITDAVPFIVVVVALFMFGRTLPERGATERDPLPGVILPRNRPRVIVPLVVTGVAAIVLTEGSYRFAVVTSLTTTMIALSLVLLTGLVGQISLAQAAFAGAAGFALSKIGTGLPFPITMLVAGIVAGVLGVLVGIPALRIRGAQLAVVTLAAALAIEQFVFRNPRISPITGNPIPHPKLLGVDLSVRHGTTIARIEFGLFVLAVVVLAAVAVANIMRSASGRRFLAVRANERAGASLGISVSAVKLTAFGMSSFLAGIGGALIGYSRGQLSPDSFGLFVGISLLAFAYLGGITSVSGAFVAGAFAPLGLAYVILNRWAGGHIEAIDDFYVLLSGLGLILTAIFNPVGIAGAIRENTIGRRERTLAERQPPTAPVAPPAAARPPRSASGEALQVSEISVSYGGVVAVDRVSLAVPPRNIVGLIGPNGAGKTTLIDAITGFVPCSGRVWLGDRDLTNAPAHRRATGGIVRTWQSLELFDELTVRQNVMVGAEQMTARNVALDIVRPSRVGPVAQIDWVLDLLGLMDVANERPSALPLGRQKLLGVSRALGMSPSVVLLDEPAAGLDPGESAAFGQRLRAIADAGMGVLLVDHDMHLVMDVCDDVYVIDFGRLLAHGRPDQVRTDTGVIEAYLGQAASEMAER